MLSGFSQEILAEKAELHPNYLGRVERGEEHISLISLRRIAEGHRAARATIADGKTTSGATGRVGSRNVFVLGLCSDVDRIWP